MGSVPVAVRKRNSGCKNTSRLPVFWRNRWRNADALIHRDPQWVDVIRTGMLAGMLQKAMEYKIPFLHKLVKVKSILQTCAAWCG